MKLLLTFLLALVPGAAIGALTPDPACAFRGASGIALACVSLVRPDARGSIVLVNGYSESLRKYEELARELFNEGYSVFLYDHRGQGESQRLLPDPRLATIDQFQNFVDDLGRFVDLRVRPETHGPLILFAHSFGGAVGARYIELHSKTFDAVILSAPMLGIRLPGYPTFLVKLILFYYQWRGQEEDWLRSPTSPLDDRFLGNQLTSSELRFGRWQSTLAEVPTMQIWGRTNRWLQEALKASATVTGEAHRIETPLLLLQADDDAYVTPEPQAEFCAKAKRCELMKLKGSRHEILQESDDIRAAALTRVKTFLNRLR